MIIIVGSSVDDILYFASKLKNKQEIIIFKKYRVITGMILNRPIALVYDVHSDYMSLALLMHLIEKFHAIMVFGVGKCRSLTSDIKKGTIAISRQVFLGDVNQIGIGKVSYGQIPSLPSSFVINGYVSSIIKEGALRVVGNRYKICNFVTTNQYDKTREDIKRISVDDKLFGHHDSVIMDGETGGIAVACTLYDIPYISIKVVEGEVEEKLSEEHIFDAYKAYPLVGKIVTYCLGEIGRSDMLPEQ